MSILLAISSDMHARLVARLLEPLNQPIVIAHTADEAEYQAGLRSFEVIIVDTSARGIDGIDLVRTVAKQSPQASVLVLNPSTDVSYKVQALEAGADDYMVSPYEPAELIVRVKAVLRRHSHLVHASRVDIMRVGLMELDVDKLEVSVPGRQRIHLTPSEMRLLLYLMTHIERAVDQHELMVHLFGPTAQQVTSSMIGVYMRRLRCKLEQDPDHPRYIVTVRGQGYQLQAPDEEKPLLSTTAPSTPQREQSWKG